MPSSGTARRRPERARAACRSEAERRLGVAIRALAADERAPARDPLGWFRRLTVWRLLSGARRLALRGLRRAADPGGTVDLLAARNAIASSIEAALAGHCRNVARQAAVSLLSIGLGLAFLLVALVSYLPI